MKSFFWKDKKILVTGAGGFLGTALVTALKKEGAQVIAVSKTATQPDIVAADVTSKRQLEVFFSAPDLFACFHLAGIALVEQGKTSPYTTFKNNIVGTLNVLELGKIYGIKRIVISSTAHVYGDAAPPTLEDNSPRPSRPYETSKTCADLIAQSYANSYQLPVLIPRFVNIYGPGDINFSRLIPKTIRSILLGQSPTLWGGGAKRDFLYVDDAVRAFLLLGQMEDSIIEANRIFNFGTGEIVSIKDLMTKIIEVSGKKVPIQKTVEGREQEVLHQYVSWDKANTILGWKPETQLTEGLVKTIIWYQEYLARLGYPYANARSASKMRNA